MVIVFWTAACALAYVYLGYPLIAALTGSLVRRGVRQADHEPRVTIVIAAHNEEAAIGATLENKLTLDYPAAKVQIIVVSDASTDRTDSIVRELGGDRVRLLRQESRQGKTAALNRGARHATGDVLVFADANSMYAPDALHKLTRNFSDVSVGYVTGRLVYGTAAGSATARGCSLYMAYEHRLRVCETMLGSIVGVNGGIDAMRARLYTPMHPDQLPDLVLPLGVVRAGYRVVYEPEALLAEQALASPRAEYAMRLRVSLRALWTLFEWRELLRPRYGAFAWQLWSHKVLRYFAFVALAAMFVASCLAPGWLYRVSGGAMSGALVLALAGLVFERRGRSTWLLTVPYYFLLVNAAAAHAVFDFCRGRRRTVWAPRLG
jgi:glycosyltransferase involved in cell wall biosynthesis